MNNPVSILLILFMGEYQEMNVMLAKDESKSMT